MIQEKKRKIDFQDGRHGHLGFSIETTLATFDLQVTTMLPTELQVNRPLDSREEAKNRFQDGQRPSWISNRNDLAIFDLQITLMLPTKFQVSLLFGT